MTDTRNALTAEQRDGISARLHLMQTLQEAARTVTLPLFSDPSLSAQNKADTGYDPVTQADIDAEESLRAIITNAFPDDGIHGEEFPDIDGSNDWLWTLDPIDGTRGFVAGIPVWSTLIAVSFKSQPTLGLMDFPALDKAYWGTSGRAWVMDGEAEIPLKVRKCEGLSEAVIGCTEPLSMLSDEELMAYNKIRHATRFSRLGLDAFGYAMVASGRMDVIIEAGLKPCDVRALMPVIEGAGGAITSWEGGSAVDGGRVVAVGDARLLPKLHDHLGSVPKRS